jgi:adenylosuccinate lyase
VKADPDITAKLSAAEIDRTFSLDHYLRNVDQIFARLGIT